MKPTPFIQVAGIIDKPELELLLSHEVPFLGFPLRLPVNQEDLSEAAAAALIQEIPSTSRAILITYLDQAAAIIAFCEQLQVDWVQLHGTISPKALGELRETRPELTIIKSLVVRSDNLPQLKVMVNQLQEWVDYFITDTFDPSSGASGATGKTHDWAISRALVAYAQKPVILAGGLNAQNVGAAILEVQPAGVDVHTGVEDRQGRKDPVKLRAFMEAAKAAFKQLEAD